VAEQREELVKVHFELPEPDMGVGGESLWAAPLGNDLYELRNSPWHARQVNWFDVVEARPEADDKWPEFVKVHKRSGHRTVHLYILDLGQPSKDRILQRCNQLGATYENMDGRMYALDFAPDIEVAPAIEYLTSLQEQELLDWRINEYE
jgi:hypothetical protein